MESNRAKFMSKMSQRHRICFAAFTAVATFSLAAPNLVNAFLYKWQDNQGAIYFTNDPESIPSAFRDSVQRLGGGFKPRFQKKKKPGPIRPNRNSAIVAPLTVKSNQYFVATSLNETITVNLLLDTGSSVVVISEELGRKLGYQDFDRMPQVEVETAGGRIWTPLINLELLRIADAEMENVEAVINPMVRNIDGLLGMSFLNQFKIEIDYSGAKMFLKPIAVQGEKLYQGKSEGWWQERLDSYYDGSVHFKAMAEKMREKEDPKAFNVGKTAEHYRKLYLGLMDRARRMRFPAKQRSDR